MKAAAFFDLDKTVISKSSSLALARPMYRAGLVNRSAVVKGAYAQIIYLLLGADEKKLDRLKEGMLSLSKGWDREEVEDVVRQALVELIDPFIYQEALDLMELHRSEGRLVFIVSSSPEEVVRPLAEHFGQVGVIATRAKIVDGKYSGELEFYCAGEGKAEAIADLAARRGIDLTRSYAYSDSSSDLPMLEIVGNPVAVNPDRELRKIAAEREWQVRDFRRPVRLRDRLGNVPKPPPKLTGVVLAGAAGALVGWMLVKPRLPRPDRAGAKT